MKRFIFSLCAVAVFGVACSSGEILSGFRANIAFNVATGQIAASWGESLAKTKGGLSVASNSWTNAWIQTDRIPVGLAWRPPREAEVTVAITGMFTPEFVKDDRSVDAYIRYGCDGTHWSTWIPMTHGYEALEQQSLRLDSDSRENSKTVFCVVLRIPAIQQEAYDNRRGKWKASDPEWSSDEDEYSRWLLQQAPDFFQDNLPFLGYVQVRLESDFDGAREIQSIDVSGSWGVGGLHDPPRDGKSSSAEKQWNLLLRNTDERKPNKPADHTR